jgi:DNA-binding CsgD family transcriptional regulator/tetratricopeptide (TPR) repeat protein
MRADEHFVDRDAELDRLAAMAARATAGQFQVLLLGGEAGIGKTALVQHFGEHGHHGGSFIRVGTPVPAAGQVPYAPIVELLRIVSRERVAALERLGSQLNALAPILPMLAPDARDFGSDPFGRIRLLDALRALVEELAREQPPLLLVMDDVQWADDASLESLSYLSQQLGGSPAMLVAIYRSDETDAVPSLRRLLVEVVRLEHAVPFELGGLDTADLLQMATSPDTSRARQRLAAMARRAAGNPYFFKQLLESPSDSTTGLPPSLRALLLQRVEAFPPGSRAVLRVAAVLGRPAPAALIGAVLAAPDLQILAGLRGLVQAGLLAPPSEGSAGYSFRQPLIQEAVLDDMLPEERVQLHDALARTLEQNPSWRVGGAAGQVELAIHWSSAGAGEEALPALLTGAKAAEEMRAFDVAERLLQCALETGHSDAGGQPRRREVGFRPLAAESTPRIELLLRKAEMAHLAGSSDRAVELTLEALGSPDLDPSRRPLVLERLGWYRLGLGDVTSSLEALDQAADASEGASDADRGRILASHGRALVLAGRYGQARKVLEEAVRRAEAAGTRGDQVRALSTLGTAHIRSGDVDAAAATFESARLIDERRGDSVIAPRPSRIGYVVGGLLDHASGLEAAGLFVEAEAIARRAAETAHKVGAAAAWGGLAAGTAAHQLFLLGRWNEADALLAEAAEMIYPAVPASAELDVVRARLATARGQLTEARSILGPASRSILRASPSAVAALFVALAEIDLWQRRPAQARASLEEPLQLIAGSEDQAALLEIASAALRADADHAELARTRRFVTEIGAITEDAMALAARVRVALTTEQLSLPADRQQVLRLLCAAELARVDGPPDPDRWSVVARGFEELREPYSAAVARWREAEGLLVGRHGQRAESVLREAHATALHLGASLLRQELEALAERGRIKLTAPPGTEPQPAAPDILSQLRRELGLSRRELEVLALIAQGRSNREIADELFITVKTASHHVSNILTKLTVSSRIEAAAVAYRVGLPEAMSAAPS